MVEPIFEKINFHQRAGEAKEQIKIDCKTSVQTENVLSVLAVSPSVTVEATSVSEGKTAYKAKATFYVSFMDSDGRIRKCECGNEISGELLSDCFNEGAKVKLTASFDKVETQTTGIYLSVIGYVTVFAQAFDYQAVPALTSGENIIINESELSPFKGLGVCRGTYPVSEEFELPYPVEEVLFHRADAVITATQCGVGSIIVDGEVLLSFVLLQKTEKSDIIKESKTVPFRIEVESEDVMPSMQAVASVVEKSIKTDVSVDEQSERSLVSVDVSLLIEGEAFSKNSLVVASDAFSTQNELEVIKEKCIDYSIEQSRTENAVISAKAQTSDLPLGTTVLAVSGENISVVSAECQGENLLITGVYSAIVYLKDVENSVFTKKVESPFEKSLPFGYDCQTQVSVTAKAYKGQAKILSASEIGVESEVYFTVYPVKKCEHCVVKEVRVLGEKQQNQSAISVYIPTPGEQLWSLAKRLNVCPEKLIETNKDLQFPLTGDERIVVYRRK